MKKVLWVHSFKHPEDKRSHHQSMSLLCLFKQFQYTSFQLNDNKRAVWAYLSMQGKVSIHQIIQVSQEYMKLKLATKNN